MALLRDLELEAAILEAPLDPGPRMVYGDWLASRGDPRGEWFALSTAVETAPLDVRLRSAATELLHAHGQVLLGDGVALRPNAWFGWLGGFLDEVRLQPSAHLRDAARAVRGLVQHPHARFLRQLALGDLPDLAGVLAELAAAELPLLDTLTVVDGPHGGRSYDLDPLLKKHTLRRLGARKVVWSVALPALRELWLVYDARDGVSLEQIADTAPNLEELTIDCSVQLPAFGRILDRLPRLRRFRVINCGNPEPCVRDLTPPPPGLELVDISHSALEDEDATWIARWPASVALVALRTNLGEAVAEQLRANRSVVSSRPALGSGSHLRTDDGPDSWFVHQLKTAGRRALQLVPNGGEAAFASAIRNHDSRHYDPAVMELCVTLPSTRWGAWPWAAAARARSWRGEHALSEAIAREALMREPHEPNFHAFVTYALRRQGLLTEAVAEVPRAESALARPASQAQEGGALCLIDCMYTLAQGVSHAAALALADRLARIDDPNLQAMRAMCHVAAGDAPQARAALARAAAVADWDLASYVHEPARRAVFDHATAVVALLDQDPDGQGAALEPVAARAAGMSGRRQPTAAAIDQAMAALARAWPVYPERGWFLTDPNLAAIRHHPRFTALIG